MAIRSLDAGTLFVTSTGGRYHLMRANAAVSGEQIGGYDTRDEAIFAAFERYNEPLYLLRNDNTYELIASDWHLLSCSAGCGRLVELVPSPTLARPGLPDLVAHRCVCGHLESLRPAGVPVHQSGGMHHWRRRP